MVDPHEKPLRVVELGLDYLEETAFTSCSADSGLTCSRRRCLNSLQRASNLFAFLVDSTVSTCSTEDWVLDKIQFVGPVWRGLSMIRPGDPVAIWRKWVEESLEETEE